MQFQYASIQGVEKANENKNGFEMVRCPGVPDIV
jgi:hypothetical protein